MTTDKIKGELAALIRVKMAELMKLNTAYEALDKKGATIVRRRRKPNDNLVNAGKVTNGGRLNGYPDRIEAALKANRKGLTTKEISEKLFEKGLGVSRKGFDQKIMQMLSRMKSQKRLTGRATKQSDGFMVWRLADAKL